MLSSASILRLSGRLRCFCLSSADFSRMSGRQIGVTAGRFFSSSSLKTNQTEASSNSSKDPPKLESSADSTKTEPKVVPLTGGQKLKAAARDYGSAVLIFHIASGVTLLGMWYLIISSGVDVNSFLLKLGYDFSTSRFAQGAGTFALAYAVHKATAPIRIGLTLTIAPLIVNYLRRKGIMSIKK